MLDLLLANVKKNLRLSKFFFLLEIAFLSFCGLFVITFNVASIFLRWINQKVIDQQININVPWQRFIWGLCLTSAFAFKIEFLRPLVIEQLALASWKWSYGSKGEGAHCEFSFLVSKHALTACLWLVFRVD